MQLQLEAAESNVVAGQNLRLDVTLHNTQAPWSAETIGEAPLLVLRGPARRSTRLRWPDNLHALLLPGCG